MIAAGVLSKQGLEDRLTAEGFVKTGVTTATGEFWRCTKTNKHVLVPFPYDGFYPNELIEHLQEHIGKIYMGPHKLH